MGRAVILVSHASGFLRLCRRALHKLAWLTPIPVMTKVYTKTFLLYYRQGIKSKDLLLSINTLV